MVHDNLSKLHWSCRRGMLELDVLLNNFLKEAYPSLSPEDKTLFATLLSHPDPELFEWLLGKSIPSDAAMAHIVNKIRQHAVSRI